MPDFASLAADFGEASKFQLELATQVGAALLRSVETIRDIHLRAADYMLARFSSPSKDSGGHRQETDALESQLQLFGKDLQVLAQYWQELANAAARMQGDIAACCLREVEHRDAREITGH